LLRSLKKGGRIQVVTDYAEYFEVISNLFKRNGEWLEACEFTPAASIRDGEVVGTKYERKYNRSGRDILLQFYSGSCKLFMKMVLYYSGILVIDL